MAETAHPPRKHSGLRPGDHVAVHIEGYPDYNGLVEEFMPQFNVIWVRDLRTGERRMLSTDEHRLLRH